LLEFVSQAEWDIILCALKPLISRIILNTFIFLQPPLVAYLSISFTYGDAHSSNSFLYMAVLGKVLALGTRS
jgi:hypothetical protein